MTEVDRRLDELAKSLADRGHTRRGVLKLGAGAFGAMVAAVLPARAWTAPGEPGGNSACAHFCHDVFQGSDAGHCTSDAAHGTGPCVRCAGDVSRICGRVTTPDQLVCCVPNKQTCCVDPTTGKGACCTTSKGEFCCPSGVCHPRCPDGQIPNPFRCSCRCPGSTVPCGDACCDTTEGEFCCPSAGACHPPCPPGTAPDPVACTCV
jgi:hypothetical protein